MTDPSDISRLFKHIGVSDANYQEIGKQRGARESQSRWPLLDSLHAQANRAPEVDTRKRFDIDAAGMGQTPRSELVKKKLFSHKVISDDVAVHPATATPFATTHPDDLNATNEAMAAVLAAPAPAPVIEPQQPTSAKVAEFIAPRAKGLGGTAGRVFGREPYVPGSEEPVASIPTSHALPRTATFSSAGPVATSGPLTSVARSHATPLNSAPAQTSASAQAPSPAQAPAPTARSASVFDKLANPGGAAAAEAATPLSKPAPLSIFERLIRS